MNEKERLNIWMQLGYAITKPSAYKNMLKLDWQKRVMFLCLLMVLTTMIQYVIPASAMITGFGGFENLFLNRVAAFTFENGQLEVEKVISISDGALMSFKVDTSVDAYGKDDFEKDGYPMQCLVSKSNIILLQYDRVTEFLFSDPSMEGVSVTNESLLRIIPVIYIGMIVLFGFYTIENLLIYLFISLIFAISGLSINATLHTKLSFGSIYMIALYSGTAAWIISSVNTVLGAPVSSLILSIGSVILTSIFVFRGIAAYAVQNSSGNFDLRV